MKVSEITTEDIASYLKLDYEHLSTSEVQELDRLLVVAKKYIQSYTALTDEEIDIHDEFHIVVLVLCQDMYDNRTLYAEKSNVSVVHLNPVIKTILDMHSKNLL